MIAIGSLGKLGNLKTLSADNNRIASMEGLRTAKSLESLSLAYNEVASLEELSTLKKLFLLNLSNNRISNVTPLSALTNLQSLNISHNQISDISPVRSLPELTLTNMDFSKNPLPDYVFTEKNNEEFILNILSPYIAAAIKQYYGESRQYRNAGILNSERTDGRYRFTIRVETFVGAHNPPYGLETIRIIKDNSGIKIEDFIHADI